MAFNLFQKLNAHLMKPRRSPGDQLTDFERLCYEIRSTDVLLIAGRSYVSDIITNITHSPWTHAALYIGHLYNLEDEALREKLQKQHDWKPNQQLIVESVMGKGIIITPIEFYRSEHIRICRPKGISVPDSKQVVRYALSQVGQAYDVRQLVDLARFYARWRFLPRRWHSSLFLKNESETTKQVCSSLIAEAFAQVEFPILPLIKKIDHNQVEYYPRSPRLFTPSDFDFSPYFDIIKYPMFEVEKSGKYHGLPWNKEGYYSDNEGNVYIPSE